MRTIKFRGKAIESNIGWIYGDLIQSPGIIPVIQRFIRTIKIKGEKCERFSQDKVHPQTIGQFTGFYDTNGQPIFEGDILKCRIKKFGHIPYVVGYRLGVFETRPNNQDLASSPLKYLLNDDDEGTTLKTWTVIGNIHDNPELLKGGEK